MLRVTGRIDALRADLRAIGCTTEGVQALLGPVAAAALHREQTVPVVRATAGDEPLAHAIRLFTLGMPIAADAVERAFPATGLSGLQELGLIATDTSSNDTSAIDAGPVSKADLVRATCDLRPYGDESHDWWVASDLSELATGGPLREDHVLGIGGASTTLASWTPRIRAERALDMGCGCGVQTLHLSTHCEQVVATDISERACEYTRFNLALNGIDNVEVRRGSLFEPVEGEQFGLVVSNPPFVITPRAQGVPAFEYRDGGMVGDDLVRTVVQSVPPVLRTGGIAQLLGNWEIRAGQDWREVVAGWLAVTEVDAWVVQRETQDPAEYAELWSRDGGHRPGTTAYEQLYGAWLDDFAARGVESVGFGIMTLRRPADAREPVRLLEEVSGPVASPMGPTVVRSLRAQEWLATHDVFDERWTMAADVTEERYARPGADDPSIIRLTQGGGLRQAVQIDTAMAAYASVADGELSARAAFTAIAALLEEDAEQLITSHREALEALVGWGMLEH